MKWKWVFILITVGMSACDMIEYHPYDVSLSRKYTDLNRKSMERIIATQGTVSKGDTIRFAFMGDTQRSYDETVDFVNAINRRHDIDFVIHGGDITDFGMAKEYVWIHDIMKKLKVPYVAVIGNHDILGHGKEVYQSIYGDYNFSFVYKQTKFLFLNTNALEFDYSTPIPDFGFIQNELNRTDEEYQQTIVAMHVQPYDIEFNNNTASYFQQLIRQFKNPLFCIHAHAHVLMANDFFKDGLMYYGCDDIHDKNYMVFTVVNGSYSYEVVKF
jgi:3',5'-cyclic AMP phosphodiesterase CpdA